MGRLIDADAINGTFAPSETYTGREVMALLNQQPTAFDVDKVVEQLAKRFDYCHEMAEKNDKAKLEKMAFSWRQVANGVMDAIYIVKGAVNE